MAERSPSVVNLVSSLRSTPGSSRSTGVTSGRLRRTMCRSNPAADGLANRVRGQLNLCTPSPTKVTAAQSQPSGKTSPQSARRVGGKRVSSPTPGDGTPKHASSCKRAKLVSPTGATNFEFQGAAAAGLAQMGGVAAARAIPVRKRKVWIPDVYDDAVIKYCQQCMSNGTAPDAVYVGQKLIGGREGAAAIKAIKRRPAVYTLWKEAVAAAKQGGIAAGGVAASSSAPPRGFSESAKINRSSKPAKGPIKLANRALLAGLSASINVLEHPEVYLPAFTCDCGSKLNKCKSSAEARQGKWGARNRYDYFLPCSGSGCSYKYSLADLQDAVKEARKQFC